MKRTSHSGSNYSYKPPPQTYLTFISTVIRTEVQKIIFSETY